MLQFEVKFIQQQYEVEEEKTVVDFYDKSGKPLVALLIPTKDVPLHCIELDTRYDLIVFGKHVKQEKKNE